MSRPPIRVVDGREVPSTEPATCAECGADGLRGDFPDQGGIVPDASGRLVCDGCADVTLETMPDHLRGSHRAARNWGVYPHNGAERTRMPREDAEAIVESDPDGYAHIVEVSE